MKTTKGIKFKLDQDSLKRKLIDYPSDSSDDTEIGKDTKLCKVTDENHNIKLIKLNNQEPKKKDHLKKSSSTVSVDKKSEDSNQKKSEEADGKKSKDSSKKKNEDSIKKKNESTKRKKSKSRKRSNSSRKDDKKVKRIKEEISNQVIPKAPKKTDQTIAMSTDGSCNSSCDCSCSDGECSSCSSSSTVTFKSSREAIETSSTKPKSNHKSSNSKEETIKTFEQLNVSSELLKGIYKLDIFEPNRLQRILLPRLKENKLGNILIQSRLLDGKKTAFLISNLSRVKTDLHKPQVLILAPTIELVFNIYEMAKLMAKYSNITMRYMCRDNQSVGEVINQHVIISTLGLLKYLLTSKSFDTSKVKIVVMDEFDVLTSNIDNFTCLKIITNHLDTSIQYQCYSTFFGETPFLAMRKMFSSEFERINLLKSDYGLRNMLQFKVNCTNLDEKFIALKNILNYSIFTKLVVYVSGKNIASEIERKLVSNGYQAVLLTSDSPLDERLQTIEAFKKSNNKIIIVNYPQAHGFDLGIDLLLIINYDLPWHEGKYMFEYYHKICNTGRASRPGFVVNLIDNKTLEVSYHIERECKVKFIKLDAFNTFKEKDRKI